MRLFYVGHSHGGGGHGHSHGGGGHGHSHDTKHHESHGDPDHNSEHEKVGSACDSVHTSVVSG